MPWTMCVLMHLRDSHAARHGVDPCWWVCHGPALTRLWVCHGPALTRLWVCHGPALTRLWVCHGPALTRLWVCHGPALTRLVGVSWPSTHQAVGVSWPSTHQAVPTTALSGEDAARPERLPQVRVPPLQGRPHQAQVGAGAMQGRDAGGRKGHCRGDARQQCHAAGRYCSSCFKRLPPAMMLPAQ
jgi:hypothetical protein